MLEVKDKTDNGSKESELEFTRRSFTQSLLFASLSTLTGCGLSTDFLLRGTREKLREQELLYGNQENPAYTIVFQDWRLRVPTFQETIEAGLAKLELLEKYKDLATELETELNGLSAALKAEQTYLQTLNSKSVQPRSGDRAISAHNPEEPVAPPAFQLRYRTFEILHSEIRAFLDRVVEHSKEHFERAEMLQSMLGLVIQEGKQSLEMHENSYTELEQQYGPPENYARLIAKRLTGLDLPEQLELDIKAIRKKNTAGTTDSVDGKIIAEDSHYAVVVSVLLHEIGHIIARNQETQILNGGTRKERKKADQVEEAAAYAAQIAGAAAIDDPELGELNRLFIRWTIRHRVMSYFEGDHTFHSHALTLADAAVTVYGDPGRAFNQLSRATSIDPAILHQVEVNRALYKRYKEKLDKDLALQKWSEVFEGTVSLASDAVTVKEEYDRLLNKW